MTTEPTSTDQPLSFPDDMSVQEVADELRKHPGTIRRWYSQAQNPLPHRRVAGIIVLRRSEVHAWLSGGGE